MTTGDYWQQKLGFYLHDPMHKVLDIQGHERRAAEIAELLHVSRPTKTEYQRADMIASGLSRADLPGYSQDKRQNGAVDFKTNPVLTHPLVRDGVYSLKSSDMPDADRVQKELCQVLIDDLGLGRTFEEMVGLDESERPLSGFFHPENNREEWAKALYFYLFFAFPQRLRQKNVGGIGPYWDLLPADSRMPDNTIWHHMALTSAVGSAIRNSPTDQVGLGVFSIGPVQPFIGKARKLRDHWVGSVILSYLSFCGLRHIIEELGPDHIVYPSLHDQELVEQWLSDSYHLGRFLADEQKKERSGIASFPNKFVFICAEEHLAGLFDGIREAVRKQWHQLGEAVHEKVSGWTKGGDSLYRLFFHQTDDYWQFSHAGCRLSQLEGGAALTRLLHPKQVEREYQVIKTFSEKYRRPGIDAARLYGASHTLLQSLHAASKARPQELKQSHDGAKCPLCGEHEILHDYSQAGRDSAKEYSRAVANFWRELREKANSSAENYSQVGKTERLCAVCTMKRFLPLVAKKNGRIDPALKKVLSAHQKFPSTTELASATYLQQLERANIITRDDPEYRTLIDRLHDSEVEVGLDDDEQNTFSRKIQQQAKAQGIVYGDRDKYYALLLMDGDNMGSLINGETIDARWRDVLHPELLEKFTQDSFQPTSALRSVWSDTRLQNPALHARISSALNSFARFSVAPVIRQSGGQLIYAGGDDVCAVLPVDTALHAAQSLQQSYRATFVDYDDQGAREVSAGGKVQRLGMHLGRGPGISISAALLFAHHKVPLREVIQDGHSVLEKVAKNRAGRNALALRLKKRSGGDRDIWFQWDQVNPFNQNGTFLVEDFHTICREAGADTLSASLLYRLADLREALETVWVATIPVPEKKERIIRLIEYEVGHSAGGALHRKKTTWVREIAERLAGLLVAWPPEKGREDNEWFQPEAAVIAGFLAQGRQQRRDV